MPKSTNRGRIGYFAEDAIMLILLITNLLFISFDWLFQSQLFRDGVFWISPEVHDFYAVYIHPDFVVYDLIFVSIFLFEFFLRWLVSVIRKDYQAWYYFPFIHWYDIVGCIPIGAFRFLRLLRVISIAIRLHKIGWIDLTKMPVFSMVIHYFNEFVQLITDRVTLKILSNIRTELKDGTPVIERIASQVIKPRQQVLIDWISERLRLAASKGYELHEDEIREYIQVRINEAVENNSELKTLESIPLMGRFVVGQIEGAISNIVFNVTHGMIRDLASDKNRVFVGDVSRLLLTDTDSEEHLSYLNIQLADVLSESLEIVMLRIKNEDLSPLEKANQTTALEAKVRKELNI